VGRRAFEEELRRALEALPSRFRGALRNVAIVVEEWPPDWLLDELGVPDDDTIYGFYHGVPLPERSVSDPYGLPDKISLYRGPLEEDFPDGEELRHEIRVTLLHEIGHYFGMTEEELARLGYE